MSTTQIGNNSAFQGSKRNKPSVKPNKFILDQILYELMKSKGLLISFLSDTMTTERYNSLVEEAERTYHSIYG